MLTYKTIGDSLTEDEFNAFVTLIRCNMPLTRLFTITTETVKDDYYTLQFSFDGATILDNGILITTRTKENTPSVELKDVIFKHSTHTLHLRVCDRENYDLYNRNRSFEYTTIDIPLEEDTPVDLPVTDLDDGLIILFNDADVLITHDIPTIKPTT